MGRSIGVSFRKVAVASGIEQRRLVVEAPLKAMVNAEVVGRVKRGETAAHVGGMLANRAYSLKELPNQKDLPQIARAYEWIINLAAIGRVPIAKRPPVLSEINGMLSGLLVYGSGVAIDQQVRIQKFRPDGDFAARVTRFDARTMTRDSVAAALAVPFHDVGLIEGRRSSTKVDMRILKNFDAEAGSLEIVPQKTSAYLSAGLSHDGQSVMLHGNAAGDERVRTAFLATAAILGHFDLARLDEPS